MTKEQAFQILSSVYPILRLNEQERQNILQAYNVIGKELGIKTDASRKAEAEPKGNRKSRRAKK